MIARLILPLFLTLLFTTILSGEEPGTNKERPSFGRRQLDQLLDDRPDMKGILPEDHPVFQWVAKGFNGDRFGMRIYWVADSPGGDAPSDSSIPYEDTPPFVRVSAGTELTPIDKWTVLVFELNNIQGSDQFSKLFEQAIRGTINGKKYATGCVQTEFKTSVMTQEFLLKNPLPQSNHGRDHRYKEIITRPSITFEEYQKTCRENDSPLGNFDHFLKYYRQEIVPYIDRNDSTKSK